VRPAIRFRNSGTMEDGVMEFQSKDYYEAARERLNQSHLLFDMPQEDAKEKLDDKRYALVVYIAGVGAEAMFRAYRLRVDTSFEGRHNLSELFIESGLDEHLREALEARRVDPAAIDARLTELQAAVDSLSSIWRNDQRYAADRALVRDFIKRRLIPRKANKGDKAALLRVQAHKVLDAAAVIIRAGEEAWK